MKNTSIVIRVSSETKDTAKDLAKAENRSVSNLIEHLLTKHAESLKSQERK